MTSAPPRPDTRPPRILDALVRTYPRSWRANGRGEELLTLLLDASDASGRSRPAIGDLVDVAAHGLWERARTTEVILPATSRTRIAQACLAVGFGLSLFLTLGGEIRIAGFSDGHSPYALDYFLRDRWGPFLTLGIATYIAWCLTLARYLTGSARGTRELAAITTAITLAIPALAALTSHQRPPGGTLCALVVLAFGVTLIPAGGSLNWPARVTPLILGLAITAALIAWRLHALGKSTSDIGRDALSARPMFYWDPNGDRLQINRAIATPAMWLAIAALAMALAAWYWNKTWFPVACFLCLPVLAMRLGTQDFSAANAARDAIIWSAAIIAVVVLNGVVIARLWRLPWARRRVNVRRMSSHVGKARAANPPVTKKGDAVTRSR